MDNEIASNVLAPEVVMETGKQMRKALLANLTPQEIQLRSHTIDSNH